MTNQNDSDQPGSVTLTRRDALKLSGMALGSLAISGGAMSAFASEKGAKTANCNPSGCPTGSCEYPPVEDALNQYTFFKNLPQWNPKQGDPYNGVPETYIPPQPNEMRITFLGSNIPNQLRKAQQMMSVFVEVGDAMGEADQFVFDFGSGVCANYNAMGISPGRMDKIFLTHLHGDHMSDLIHLYCFGAGMDRKSPLFIWGAGPSGVRNPNRPHNLYNDGIRAFCRNLRETCRWHTESQSFISTSYKSYQPPTKETWGLPCKPVPVSDDPPNDGYAIIPIELDWTKYGKKDGDNIAYWNKKTGAKITHYPVIHNRKGSIAYKLEWNGLSMIFTGDTKPEYHSVRQAAGVTVFIHEINPPADQWGFKNMGLYQPPLPNWSNYASYQRAVNFAKMVQNSSHTPIGAFGYLLSQINPRPQLTIGTHFPTADDTEGCARSSIEAHNPDIVWGKDVLLSYDLMVIRVFQDGAKKARIEKYQAVVSDFTFAAVYKEFEDLNPPKYWKYAVDENGNKIYDANGKPVKIGDPFAQIDVSTEIPSCDDGKGNCNYRDDGY